MNSRKIRGRMVELGLNQKDIGKVLNCAPPTVSQKLNGIRPIYLDEAEKLAVALKLSEKEYYEFFFKNADCVTQ